MGREVLAVAAAQFGLRLLSQLVKQMPGKNVLVSPVGLFQTLSLYAFLGGETARTEMRKALHIPPLSDEALRSLYLQLKYQLLIRSRDTKLALATALWIGDQVDLDASFAALAEQRGITVFSGIDVALSRIRRWSREKSHRLISTIIDPPAGDSASLMDAVYFHGAWETKFNSENTKEQLFYRAGALPNIAVLMRQPKTEGVFLYRSAEFDAVRIPYERDGGLELSMQMILPRRTTLETITGRDCITPLVERFTLSDWDECQAGYTGAVMDLKLPYFRLRQTHDLWSVLQQMGMGAAFNVAAAQTTFPVPTIQKVQQKVTIEVREEGAIAAVLPEAVACGASPDISSPQRPLVEKFYVNHPFLFFLTDDESGLPLLIGVIHDPEV